MIKYIVIVLLNGGVVTSTNSQHFPEAEIFT